MDVVSRDSAVAFTTLDTSTIREILSPRNSVTRRQSLAEAVLRHGVSTLAHSHPNTEEIYYLLYGEGLMAIEEERRSVLPGDGIIIPPGTRHQILNTGSEDLVVLCCCVPAYEHTDTVMCDPLIR
jgi:mannose-6-phosphate isomerase-like protein (cupin superfamily)